MTDVTTDDPTAGSEPAPVAETPAIAPPAAVSFWQRPNVRRYLMPLLTPILVVAGLVVYVLNLSRVFLSAHGHTSVMVGSTVTIVILVGATVLSNSSRLKSSSIGLMTAIFVLVVFGSGWLVLGHSQVKGGSLTPLVAAGPSQGTLQITAAPGGAFKFAPNHLTATTGIYTITLTDGAVGGHTLNFDNPATLWAGVQVGSQGSKATSRIFFGAPGDYTFFCNIPGHRAAGMFGDILVTGPTVTLAQAEAAGGK